MDDISSEDYESLERIRKYATKTQKFTENLSYEDFVMNELVQDACILNIEVIGEETKSLSVGFEYNHPEIPIRSMYGMRNHIAHNYEGVNLKRVWQTIKEDLPLLIAKIETILSSQDKKL